MTSFPVNIQDGQNATLKERTKFVLLVISAQSMAFPQPVLAPKTLKNNF